MQRKFTLNMDMPINKCTRVCAKESFVQINAADVQMDLGHCQRKMQRKLIAQINTDSLNSRVTAQMDRSMINRCSVLSRKWIRGPEKKTERSKIEYIWGQTVFNIERIINDPENDYPSPVKKEILAVLNRRHSQLFHPGGRLYNGAYLVGAYLNPDFLSKWRVTRSNIQHTTSLYAGMVVPRKELKAYSRRRFPFNGHFERNSSTQGIIGWWKICCSEEDGAVILPWYSYHSSYKQYLAMKIYSMCVNSMADERTASTFTWMTPATHNSMSVNTMGAKTMIYQFYRAEESYGCKSESQSHASKSKKFFELKNALSGPKLQERDEESEKAAEEKVAEAGSLDDSWLDEEPDGEIYFGPSPSLLNAANVVNPDSFEFTSILADKEMLRPGAPGSSMASIAYNSGTFGEDNDFSSKRVTSFLTLLE
ncbi:hypothetical protein K435DRAFT_803641 [Dendrothele bispora CBS 962.96]|uniref:Uncharacterized protein n=1 Tax=Dendrothele bispora (strain CBS 962.96) TaxID=1314807 RepID=A0A4S8LI57_DENBC|nr:hypothetical protein K435DRAFT_803641 [Dendrothele bispora CBS 962.96]